MPNSDSYNATSRRLLFSTWRYDGPGCPVRAVVLQIHFSFPHLLPVSWCRRSPLLSAILVSLIPAYPRLPLWVPLYRPLVCIVPSDSYVLPHIVGHRTSADLSYPMSVSSARPRLICPRDPAIYCVFFLLSTETSSSSIKRLTRNLTSSLACASLLNSISLGPGKSDEDRYRDPFRDGPCDLSREMRCS